MNNRHGIEQLIATHTKWHSIPCRSRKCHIWILLYLQHRPHHSVHPVFLA